MARDLPRVLRPRNCLMIVLIVFLALGAPL
jgi:hypothetical protein